MGHEGSTDRRTIQRTRDLWGMSAGHQRVVVAAARLMRCRHGMTYELSHSSV